MRALSYVLALLSIVFASCGTRSARAQEDGVAVRASFYYETGEPMANGGVYNPRDETTVAHPCLPFGTPLRLTFQTTQEHNGELLMIVNVIKVVVRDRMPAPERVRSDPNCKIVPDYFANRRRVIDMTPAGMRRLVGQNFQTIGVVEVTAEIIGGDDQSS